MSSLHIISKLIRPTAFSRYVSIFSVAPRSLNVVPINPQYVPIQNPWIWERNDTLKFPVPSIINKSELPTRIFDIKPIVDAISNLEIDCPSENKTEKQAARLIVIRRKKMKKHKLKKLRKKMYHEWAKIRQRRELKKEKAFQAILIQQCKDAEAFSAENYVQQRIDKYKKLMTPPDVERS